MGKVSPPEVLTVCCALVSTPGSPESHGNHFSRPCGAGPHLSWRVAPPGSLAPTPRTRGVSPGPTRGGRRRGPRGHISRETLHAPRPPPPEEEPLPQRLALPRASVREVTPRSPPPVLAPCPTQGLPIGEPSLCRGLGPAFRSGRSAPGQPWTGRLGGSGPGAVEVWSEHPTEASAHDTPGPSAQGGAVASAL